MTEIRRRRATIDIRERWRCRLGLHKWAAWKPTVPPDEGRFCFGCNLMEFRAATPTTPKEDNDE